MTLEAMVFYGNGNAELPADAMGWLIEIRVEQELNKPTRFALRFEDDLCGEAPAMAGRSEIAPNTMITVVAGTGTNVGQVCLARGPIVRIRSSNQFGGSGSWVEAHCETRQVEMDRLPVQAKWTGPHDGIVKGLLAQYQFTPDVAYVTGSADEQDHQLNQSGTDFAFLNKMATDHGVDFWLTYEASIVAGTAVVSETAHYKISPPLAGELPGAIGGFSLLPTEDGPVFRLTTGSYACPTVNSFNGEADLERPTSAQTGAVDPAGGGTSDQGTEADPDTQEDGPTLSDFGATRTLQAPGPGPTEDQIRRQEAALRAAAWFVEGSASTSTELLHHIVIPHQIIRVEGAGPQLSIPYQVKQVTHVINGVAHMMDIKLRSNFMGAAA